MSGMTKFIIIVVLLAVFGLIPATIALIEVVIHAGSQIAHSIPKVGPSS
jgi:uncharacterized membrane protein YesL